MSEQLEGRELDCLVAENVMGWQRQFRYWMTFEGDASDLHALIATWKPSKNMAAAMTVEDRIAERSLIAEYIAALKEIVGLRTPSGELSVPEWALIHATAEQRCRAALAAVKED